MNFDAMGARPMPASMDIDLLASCWTTAGNVRPHSADERSTFGLRDRVEAATRAGYRGFGIVHRDLIDAVADNGYAGLRALFDDNGVEYLELEMLNDWFADGGRRAASDQVRADLLDAAEALGARQIKVGGEVDGTAWPLESLVEEFRMLCDQAAAVGTRIALEPMPFGQIRDLRTAVDVIERADHPSGGIVLDAWHMLRGGEELQDIAAIPGRLLFAVELADADAHPVGQLIEDTLDRRRLCGEGDLDLDGFIQAVHATGFDGPWGVEILSDEHRQRTLQSQVRLSYITTMWQLRLARAGLDGG